LGRRLVRPVRSRLISLGSAGPRRSGPVPSTGTRPGRSPVAAPAGAIPAIVERHHARDHRGRRVQGSRPRGRPSTPKAGPRSHCSHQQQEPDPERRWVGRPTTRAVLHRARAAARSRGEIIRQRRAGGSVGSEGPHDLPVVGARSNTVREETLEIRHFGARCGVSPRSNGHARFRAVAGSNDRTTPRPGPGRDRSRCGTRADSGPTVDPGAAWMRMRRSSRAHTPSSRRAPGVCSAFLFLDYLNRSGHHFSDAVRFVGSWPGGSREARRSSRPDGRPASGTFVA
jgi:hypothetical protein